MSLVNKIGNELNIALKQKDRIKLETLRGLRAVFLNYKIDKNIEEVDDNEVIKIIRSEIKKRNDSIEAYINGKREDLAQKEKQEINILQEYLPKQLSEQELIIIIQNKINQKGEVSQKDFGPLMGELSKELGDKADNKLISQILRSLIA